MRNIVRFILSIRWELISFFFNKNKFFLKVLRGTFLEVQWLSLHASTPGGTK